MLATNDLDRDLTTLVLRKRRHWPIETLCPDAKPFCGSAARPCCVNQTLVRHVALVLQRLRLHPKEISGEVKARLQRELFTGGMSPLFPLRGVRSRRLSCSPRRVCHLKKRTSQDTTLNSWGQE